MCLNTCSRVLRAVFLLILPFFSSSFPLSSRTLQNASTNADLNFSIGLSRHFAHTRNLFGHNQGKPAKEEMTSYLCRLEKRERPGDPKGNEDQVLCNFRLFSRTFVESYGLAAMVHTRASFSKMFCLNLGRQGRRAVSCGPPRCIL